MTDIKTDTEAVLLKGAIKIGENKMRICVIATILNIGEMITDMIEVVGSIASIGMKITGGERRNADGTKRSAEDMRRSGIDKKRRDIDTKRSEGVLS